MVGPILFGGHGRRDGAQGQEGGLLLQPYPYPYPYPYP